MYLIQDSKTGCYIKLAKNKSIFGGDISFGVLDNINPESFDSKDDALFAIEGMINRREFNCSVIERN